MLFTITQTMQTASRMSGQENPIPEALIDLLTVLRDDGESRQEMLRLLSLPEPLRHQALRKLETDMEGDSEARPLLEALQAARNLNIAQAMAQWLKDLR